MLKYSVLNVKISFQVPCVKASILSPDLIEASRQDALKLCNIFLNDFFTIVKDILSPFLLKVGEKFLSFGLFSLLL